MKYFPMPYPDELYYGIVARAYRDLGKPALSTFERQTFKANTPCGILAIKQFPVNLPADYPFSREYLSEKHTLAGLLEALRDKSVSKSHEDTDWLYSCPDCRVEAIKEFGESYWNRLHQLPQIRVCYRHGAPLQKSTRPARVLVVGELKKSDYFLPDETGWENTQPSDTTLHFEVSKILLEILNLGRKIDLNSLWNGLCRAGWTRGKYLRAEALLGALQLKYGANLKELFLIQPSEEGKILIRDLLAGRDHTPIRAALLYHFLKISPKDTIAPISPAKPKERLRGQSSRPEKTRQRHRNTFLEILKAQPKASRGEINAVNRTCSAWLRLHDRGWWNLQLADRHNKVRQKF